MWRGLWYCACVFTLPPVTVLDCSPILSSFQVILLEHIIMCRLVTGHKATALQEVGQRRASGMWELGWVWARESRGEGTTVSDLSLL